MHTSNSDSLNRIIIEKGQLDGNPAYYLENIKLGKACGLAMTVDNGSGIIEQTSGLS